MIEIIACGPLVTVQDDGRPGWLSLGLAGGGAADALARQEARALLAGLGGGDDAIGAGIETPGSPLRLRLRAPAVVALTGAPMRAAVAGRTLSWNACHPLPEGAELDLRPLGTGVYSYVHVPGGFATDVLLGSRSAHLIAGIGHPLAAGDRLPCAPSTGGARTITPTDRMAGGEVRLLPTPQTRLFAPEELDRFARTDFTRSPRGNRQGLRLDSGGAGFSTKDQLGLLSDFILPGDVQMTGGGVPYVLGPECQTTGGYPRIGTIIAADLPRAMQAVPGATLRFRFVTRAEAAAAWPAPPRATPLLRDPSEVPDLLSLQLIGGVVSAMGGGEA